MNCVSLQGMKKVLNKAEAFIMQNNLWVFLSFILLVSLIENNNQEQHSWALYGRSIGAYMLYLLPVLIFEGFKGQLKLRLSKQGYWIAWSCCFLVYLPIITLLKHDLLFMGLVFFTLELVLEIQTSSRRYLSSGNWVRKINLEAAFIFTLFLIALVISLMAVSSYGDSRFHNEQLLIGFVLDFRKIIQHFPLFLSLLFQFFLLYMVGYFFYAINHYFLVSKLLKERGIIIYLLGVLGIVVLFYPLFAQLILWLPFNKLFGNIFPMNPFDPEDGWGALAVMVLTLPVILAIQWFKQNTRIISLEKQRSETELNLLKHQLNPHFFFNTLNNLYALSLKQSGKTPDVVLQLSELMRYVIYKAKQDKVLLVEDVKYVEDYIQLQQIRLADQPHLSFVKDIKDESVQVAPMLFIILVENAFKHGIEPAENNSFCRISLDADQEKLHFICENSFQEGNFQEEGIGLHNLRKRLELLYPGKHTLDLQKKATTFRAALTLYFI